MATKRKNKSSGKKKGGLKGNNPMGEDIRDQLATISKEIAVQGERQENMAKDIKEIKKSNGAQEERCRTISTGYTDSLQQLNGRLIKAEGCVLAVKGQFKRTIMIIFGTGAIVGSVSAVVTVLLKSLQ